MSELPGARRNHSRGCLPWSDGGGGKKGTVSTVLQVKYIEEPTKRCEGLKPALARERAQTDGRLLARGLECQSCMARDETIAGGVCLDRTGVGGGGKKGTVSTVLQVKYIEEPTKRCEDLRPALARENAQPMPSARGNDNQVHWYNSRNSKWIVSFYLPQEEI